MTIQDLNKKLAREREDCVIHEIIGVLRKHYPWKPVDIKKVKELAKFENPNQQEVTERNEIAKILAENFMPEKFDDSDFEWCAFQLQQAGYHRVKTQKPTGYGVPEKRYGSDVY